MRTFIKFRPYIILVFSCIFIFIGCNNDELNEDLNNEKLVDNITGASVGKYQQLNFEEASGFVNKITSKKPSKKGNGVGTLNVNSDFLAGIDANSLVFEDVENTKHKIPTIKAHLKYPEVESKVFLVKVKDNVLGFLMNKVEEKSIDDEHFSGIIGITDLSGKFVNGYRLKNGKFVSQFVVSNKQVDVSTENSLKSKTLSYKTRTDPEKGWTSGVIMLDEVIVIEEDYSSGGDGTAGLIPS